jgi:hypothetical protein
MLSSELKKRALTLQFFSLEGKIFSFELNIFSTEHKFLSFSPETLREKPEFLGSALKSFRSRRKCLGVMRKYSSSEPRNRDLEELAGLSEENNAVLNSDDKGSDPEHGGGARPM